MQFVSAFGPPEFWLLAFVIALAAGVVKGVVGFAMPLILLSGLSSFLAPDVALACVIVPAVLANAWQALRQGAGAAVGSIRRFRVFLIAGAIFVMLSAQLVAVLPNAALLLIIGVPLTAYAGTTLLGRPVRLPAQPGAVLEAGAGAATGFIGGISGVWSPITVAMLTAMDIDKRTNVRVQGVIYGLAALALAVAHLASGVLNARTLPLSLALVPPALLGIWIGFSIQDRIDPRLFRRLTLLVLLVAGLNLIRRAMMTL